jgi:hypothetical protein
MQNSNPIVASWAPFAIRLAPKMPRQTPSFAAIREINGDRQMEFHHVHVTLNIRNSHPSTPSPIVAGLFSETRCEFGKVGPWMGAIGPSCAMTSQKLEKRA